MKCTVNNAKGFARQQVRKLVCIIILIGAFGTNSKCAEYKLFKETLHRLIAMHYTPSTLEQKYITFLKKLNKSFDLEIRVVHHMERVIIKSSDYNTLFHNPYDKKADSLLDHLRPQIEMVLEQYKIDTPYEEYLCDFLLSIHDPHSNFIYADHFDEGIPKCTGIVRAIKDKGPGFLIVLTDLPSDTGGTILEKGDTIIEINSIPAMLIPNGLFYAIQQMVSRIDCW